MDLMTLLAISISLTFAAIVATIVSLLNDDWVWRVKSEDEDGNIISHEPLMLKREAKKSIRWLNKTYPKTRFFTEREDN